MQTAFNGNTDGKFRAGEYEYDINIRFGDVTDNLLMMLKT
jgi:HAE1 family hydrophobic/amphiphilic exporter-1